MTLEEFKKMYPEPSKEEYASPEDFNNPIQIDDPFAMFKDYYEKNKGNKMKYRKKPVVIVAIKYDGTNIEEIFTAFPELKCTIEAGESKGLGIYTLEGKMICNVGDYLIKGIENEFYPCRSSVFEATYEKVEDEI